MNCDCFQIYFNRVPDGIRLRVWADGNEPLIDATLPCWAGAFRLVVRSLARGMLKTGSRV